MQRNVWWWWDVTSTNCLVAASFHILYFSELFSAASRQRVCLLPADRPATFLLLKQAVRKAATVCPRPCKLTFDLLTLKVESESCVTWPTSVPILVFLGLSVLDLGPIYTTDRRTSNVRQTDVRRALSLNDPYSRGGGIIICAVAGAVSCSLVVSYIK